MGPQAKKDMTWEKFHDWCRVKDEEEAIHASAGEIGGPKVSLVPLVNGAFSQPAPDDLDDPLAFEPEPSRNSFGWSAVRQRQFILTLAETGSVHHAAHEASMSARSAYALRVRSQPFREAWDTAQQLAVGRLSALAFDRAINGRPEQIFESGQMVHERRIPSDRLLMWLLARLDPRRFAMPWEQRGDAGDPQADASATIEGKLENLGPVEPFDILPRP